MEIRIGEGALIRRCCTSSELMVANSVASICSGPNKTTLTSPLFSVAPAAGTLSVLTSRSERVSRHANSSVAAIARGPLMLLDGELTSTM